MKNLFLTLFCTLVAFTFAYSQNPPASPRVTAENGNIKITYGQPSKKGRVIFGAEGSQSLEKYGKVWRTGANEATVITFKKDGKLGGKDVKAGMGSVLLLLKKERHIHIFSLLGRLRGDSIKLKA